MKSTLTRDEWMKRGIISGLDAETDQLNGSGFSGVPVGTIQADTLTPNGPVTGRRITGVGTGAVTRNFTPPGAINQAVVSEGAARIAAANRQPLGATAQELQERLARMLPDTIAKANERRRLRGMSDVERNEEIENIELANRVNQALGLAEPTQEQAQPGARRTGRRVNISDATGPTLDGPTNANGSLVKTLNFYTKQYTGWPPPRSLYEEISVGAITTSAVSSSYGWSAFIGWPEGGCDEYGYIETAKKGYTFITPVVYAKYSGFLYP